MRTNKISNSKITAIYVRRSVSDKDKDNNSLSIDAQKAECVRYVGENANYRIYCDDGKSGKDIAHRPAFQQMMSDAKEGVIGSIVVKKYDRFSRNMREYLNITNELDGLGISVYSLSEPFNTATKEGRMMRNNLLNFAEFERETIAARVADAYNTKARETGFYQGGKMYYGYVSERRTVNGKTGSVLVPSPQAAVVRKAFEIYKQPKTSLKDIVDYCVENGLDTAAKCKKSSKINLDRSELSRLLGSPLYVKANADIYQYFVSKGVEIIDDVSAFNGVNGLFRHKTADGNDYIKVGYHEGLIDADTWLAVQDKKADNVRIPKNKTAKNSWLVGLVKCADCGYAPNIVYTWNKSHKKLWRYYHDSGAYRVNGCVSKRFRLRPDEVEETVYKAMKDRIEKLTIAKMEQQKSNTEVENAKFEIAQINTEINTLMEKLLQANDILLDYINNKVSELHNKKSTLEEKIRTYSRKHKQIDTQPLAEPMSRWDELTTEEKHTLAMTVIEVVYISDKTGIDIKFSI